MANKKFWLGMLAISLALGMVVAGCSKDSKSGGGEADGGKGGEPGRLTITGLPEEEFIMYVLSTDKDISTFMNIASVSGSLEGVGTLITPDGNVYQLYSTEGDTWTATGKWQVVLAGGNYNKDNPMDKNNPLYRTATVNFRNGSATVKFSNFTAITKL
jgi:hypothetical protein